MTRVALCSLAALLVAAASSGCVPPGTACTDEARASVQVTVVDDAGGAVASPTVTFEAPGSEEKPCDVFPGDDQFVCGFEIAGDITVRASADPTQFAPAEKTVTVGETDDGCHVVTEQVTLTLTQID